MALASPSPASGHRTLGVCILAGGLSTRMNRDKAQVRLAGRSLLAHARAVALRLGGPVRLIRRDLVPRCGPLGGVYTGLVTSRSSGELFLACDMPFVSLKLLLRLRAAFVSGKPAVFASGAGRVGFPLILSCELVDYVRARLDSGKYSMAGIAESLGATRVRVRGLAELENINSPEDLARARARA